jgi:hypothetical protein
MDSFKAPYGNCTTPSWPEGIQFRSLQYYHKNRIKKPTDSNFRMHAMFHTSVMIDNLIIFR